MPTLLGGLALAVGVFLILCGYARSFMGRSVDGGLTVAYVWLFALTVLAWVLVWSYLRFAERRCGSPQAGRRWASRARGRGA